MENSNNNNNSKQSQQQPTQLGNGTPGRTTTTNENVVVPVPIPIPTIQDLDLLTNEKPKHNESALNIMNAQVDDATPSPMTINYNGNGTIRSHSSLNNPNGNIPADITSVNSLPNLNIRQFNRNKNNVTPSLSISSTNTESTSNQLRLFQRMEELSARLIAMEEQFQTLSTNIDRQSNIMMIMKNEIVQTVQNTISKQFDLLQKQNESMMNAHFHRLSILQSSQTQQYDSKYALDLLNSISTISAQYLSKNTNNLNSYPPDNSNSPTMRFANNSNSTATATNNTNHPVPNSIRSNNSGTNLDTLNNTSSSNNNSPVYPLPSFTNRNKTFTLNPNGIKKRKRNNHHNHIQQKHTRPLTDLNSNRLTTAQRDLLNIPIILPSDPFTNLASMNDPNMPSLQQTQIVPNTNQLQVPITLTQNNSANVKKSTQQTDANMALSLPIAQLPITVPQNTMHTDTKSKDDDDEEDGYQEDDESDNGNKIRTTDFSKDETAKGNTTRQIPNDDDDDDDDDNDEYDEEDDELPLEKETASLRKDQMEQEDNGDDEMDDENFEEDEVDEDISGTKIKSKKPQQVKKRKKTNATSKKGMIKKLIDGRGPSQETGTTASNDSNKSDDADINYTLIKAPNNVRTIWEEYVYGINGNPSIRGLEEKYGNKWRLTKNRKTFSRRKRLYKFILSGIDKGKTADEMMKMLEEKRLYKDENGEIKRRTIEWLQQSLTGI
ncbi:Transcription factor [Maudiozyma exigua]|uniref:Transcription factor n=1 Tax=Maudiozyma exigua TaxID=34358 RepID=A0A9P7BA05_MAUEX|nr:Transcription factor [Kazachstania exigua]